MNEDILEEILKKSIDDELFLPHYERFSIVNLVVSLLKHFGVETHHPPYPLGDFVDLNGVRKIVLVILDAMGYRNLEKLRERRTLRILERGKFLIGTSVFPTTTATALTSFCTALTPQEHGMMGYILFLKEFGTLTNMIEFSPVGFPRDSLLERGLNIHHFLERETIFQKLRKEGVKPVAVTANIFRNTGLSKMHHEGALVKGYHSISDMVTIIKKILREDERTFVFAYWGLADTLGHRLGADGAAYQTELYWVLRILENELVNILPKDTLLIISSDHGQVKTSWKEEIWWDRRHEINSFLEVPPSGEQRMMYFHSHNPEELKRYLESHYPEKGLYIFSKEAFEIGLFGKGEVHPRFFDRIGDLVLITKKDFSFNYKYTGKEESLKGRHGSLTEIELLIPIIAIRGLRD